MRVTGVKGVLLGAGVGAALAVWACWDSPNLLQSNLLKAICIGGSTAVGVIAGLILWWIDTRRDPGPRGRQALLRDLDDPPGPKKPGR
jgi:hypothetical protein